MTPQRMKIQKNFEEINHASTSLLPSYGSCSKSQNQSRIILTFIFDVIGIRYQKFQEMALILEFELLSFLYEALTRLVLDL